MARPRKPAPRFDARGGVNSTYSDELLDGNEVRRAINARLTKHGSFLTATGSKRLHTVALAGPIRGLVQWDAPGGAQLVAIAGGHLYHKLEAAAEFTQVASTFAEDAVIQFERHRIGAAIVLYIADGATLRKWDGVNLTTVANAPAAADLALYKGRLYASDATKTLHGSAVSQPSVFPAASGGFFGDVETFDTEGLTGILVVGDSLLLCKEDNIARLQGVDPAEIRLDTETTGVSSDVGLAATATLVALEQAAFGLSDRGPWVATEGALDLEVSAKVAAEFLAANRAQLHLAVAAHHRRRKEVWLAFPSAGSEENDQLWVYAYETRAWAGPWTRQGIAALARYELASGEESIVSGGYDGYVRREDLDGSALQDVLADGTGGTPIVMAIDYGASAHGAPGAMKSIVDEQTLQADLGADGQAEVAWESELGAGHIGLETQGAGVRSYEFKLRGKGQRLRLVVRTAGPTPCELAGFVPVVAVGGRDLQGTAAVGADALTVGGTAL